MLRRPPARGDERRQARRWRKSALRWRRSFRRILGVLSGRTTSIAAVSVLGLGSGVPGCYARSGEVWTREIDPVVERMSATTAGSISWPAVATTRPWCWATRGLPSQPTPPPLYLVIVGGFGSDSVPVHLITREALALCFAHLKPGGAALFHVRNRTSI